MRASTDGARETMRHCAQAWRALRRHEPRALANGSCADQRLCELAAYLDRAGLPAEVRALELRASAAGACQRCSRALSSGSRKKVDDATSVPVQWGSR